MVQWLHDHDLELPQNNFNFLLFCFLFVETNTDTEEHTHNCRQDWRVSVITHEPYFRKAHKLSDDHEVTFGRCQLCNQAKAISIQLI